MKKTLLTTAFIVAGFLSGIVAEKNLARDGSKQDGETQKAGPGKASPREEAAVSRAGGKDRLLTKHDFATLLRWRQQQESGNPEQVREIERMEDAELRALLADFGGRLKEAGEDAAPMSRAMELAARELYKRDGEPALVWAAAQGQGRQAMLSYMIYAAAYDDPVLALPWIDRFQKEFGRDYLSTMANEAVKGATSRGAEDLLKLRELYGERLRRVAFPSGPFPDDFDFSRFVSTMKGDSRLQSTVQYWASKDKEAAWLGLKESLGDDVPQLRNIGSIFSGVAMTEGDKKAAEWLLPKLDEVPADKRDEAIKALRGQGTLTPESLQAIMPLLRNEGERITLTATLISPWGGSNISALQCLSSDDSREEALMSVAGTYGPSMKTMQSTQREQAAKAFNSMMDELKFSEGRRERVMKTLLPAE